MENNKTVKIQNESLDESCSRQSSHSSGYNSNLMETDEIKNTRKKN